jgi:hypothetical protein
VRVREKGDRTDISVLIFKDKKSVPEPSHFFLGIMESFL